MLISQQGRSIRNASESPLGAPFNTDGRTKTAVVCFIIPCNCRSVSTNLYALIEARVGHPNFGSPFYIGIGTAKRPHKHIAQARCKKGHRNPRLHEVLAGHIASNVLPGVLIISTFTSKDEAGEAEKVEIAKYGRIGIEPDGTLCNLASGGQGPDAELMRLPEVRQRNADAQKRRSPASRAASDAALVASRGDPEIEAKRRQNSRAPQKASWGNPEIRAARIAGMKGKKKTQSAPALAARRANAKKAQSPEAKQKRSEELRRRWADPAYKARLSEKRRETWKDPAKRAAMLAGRSEGIAKSWEDPAVRARRIDGIKAASVDSVERDGEHGEPDSP